MRVYNAGSTADLIGEGAQHLGDFSLPFSIGAHHESDSEKGYKRGAAHREPLHQSATVVSEPIEDFCFSEREPNSDEAEQSTEAEAEEDQDQEAESECTIVRRNKDDREPRRARHDSAGEAERHQVSKADSFSFGGGVS